MQFEGECSRRSQWRRACVCVSVYLCARTHAYTHTHVSMSVSNKVEEVSNGGGE